MNKLTPQILKSFKNFKYHGCYIEAYTNNNNEIKKATYQPKKIHYENQNHYLSPVWVNGEYKMPNAIAVDTSKFTTLDIDKPEGCSIIDKLLIDCKFYIKTRKGYHFYFLKNNELPENYKSPSKIYDLNLPQLYFCPSYEHIETKEIFKYELIKAEKIVEIPQYAIEWINNNLTIEKYITKSKNLVSKNTEKPKEIIKPDIIIDKITIKNLKYIYEILEEAEYFEHYDLWIKTAYFTRNLNNSEEAFNLFNQFSKKSPKYKDITETQKVFYNNHTYNLDFDIMGVFCLCKKINPQKYHKLQSLEISSSKYENEFNHINHKYLYNEETKNIFNDWFDNYKALLIKSSYGTGKTYLFKKLIEEQQPKKVLFITYRKSLAFSLINELKEKYGFKLYLDLTEEEIKNSNRLIIQIDSLKKINNQDDFIYQYDNIQKYNMVVLDEIEGLLSHFSYSKLEQFKTYNILNRIIQKSEKVLCLDGDLSDRSISFIKNLNITYKIYINDFKPIQKKFIFMNNRNNFMNIIKEKLEEKKNIVIVCMTRTESEFFYNEFKEFNPIIHNSLEGNKEILKDVNKNWSLSQLLIYSPCVESGVDFNIENYFDCCFTTINNCSTSYRAFFQMLNRVRYFKENIIYNYVPSNIKLIENDLLISYDEIKFLKWKDIEETPLNQILIYNETEIYNTRNYIITSIILTLKNKGHTYEIIKEKSNNKLKNEGKELIIKLIASSPKITETEFKNLLDYQKSNFELTREQNLSIQKYIYCCLFKVNDINEDFLNDNYNNIQTLKNYIEFNKYFNDLKNNKLEIDILSILKYRNYNKFLELLKIFNYSNIEAFKIPNKNISIDENLKKNIIDFLDTKENKAYFNLDLTKNINDKNYFRQLKAIFSSYGFNIDEKAIKIKNSNKKYINTYKLNISFIDCIKNFNEKILIDLDDLEFIDF